MKVQENMLRGQLEALIDLTEKKDFKNAISLRKICSEGIKDNRAVISDFNVAAYTTMLDSISKAIRSPALFQGNIDLARHKYSVTDPSKHPAYTSP